MLLFASSCTVHPELLEESPLESCPRTPNCVHEAHVFSLSPSDLTPIVAEALESKQLDSMTRGTVDPHYIEAVYRAWSFKDDVHISIQPHEEGSVLYIRSASREGTWDLGVNKRRVKRILRDLETLLNGL